MCGWVGFLDLHGTSTLDNTITIKRMSQTLAHRGPDADGTWIDPGVGIALGFRRLAIVDLSAEGHQPMHSASGRYVIVFNGEVYNFNELRQQLAAIGHRFRGHSDTEVMLAAIEQWGIYEAVQRFIGMFAFTVWDREQRTLTLVRDRLGIKPLYYGWMGNTLLFGSELKALRVHPAFKVEIDRSVLTKYLRRGFVPSPHSIYKGINQLRPGSMVTFYADTVRKPEYHVYWSAAAVAEYGIAHPFVGSDNEAISKLDSLLREAIRLRMIADVPLGAFLSGGIDSSIIVTLMQAQSNQPIKTFSIGFQEAAYDEAVYAKAIAQFLGTDHTELYISEADALAVIPHLPTMYDEPFADSSQIPTFLISELTRNHVTVSLSGDGGDELFAGYNHYFVAEAAWRKLRLIPSVLRRSLRAGAAKLRSTAFIPSQRRTELDRLMHITAITSADDVYHYVTTHWKTPTDIVIDSDKPTDISSAIPPLSDFLQRMMLYDMLSYLPDDILTKVDRASMAVSLEARVPLLDHRVVEFAWQLPQTLKVRDKQSKWILRQVLYQYVPRHLIDRPKMGFGVPLDVWLRGSLRSWAEELLDVQRLSNEGFFHVEPIRQRWSEHLAGQRNHSFYLWNVLMFQAWLEHWSSANIATVTEPLNIGTI